MQQQFLQARLAEWGDDFLRPFAGSRLVIRNLEGKWLKLHLSVGESPLEDPIPIYWGGPETEKVAWGGNQDRTELIVDDGVLSVRITDAADKEYIVRLALKPEQGELIDGGGAEWELPCKSLKLTRLEEAEELGECVLQFTYVAPTMQRLYMVTYHPLYLDISPDFKLTIVNNGSNNEDLAVTRYRIVEAETDVEVVQGALRLEALPDAEPPHEVHFDLTLVAPGTFKVELLDEELQVQLEQHFHSRVHNTIANVFDPSRSLRSTSGALWCEVELTTSTKYKIVVHWSTAGIELPTVLVATPQSHPSQPLLVATVEDVSSSHAWEIDDQTPGYWTVEILASSGKRLLATECFVG